MRTPGLGLGWRVEFAATDSRRRNRHYSVELMIMALGLFDDLPMGDRFTVFGRASARAIRPQSLASAVKACEANSAAVPSAASKASSKAG